MQVYDLTAFAEEHPAGPESITALVIGLGLASPNPRVRVRVANPNPRVRRVRVRVANPNPNHGTEPCVLRERLHDVAQRGERLG